METRGNRLQASDLHGIERRLETVSQSLQRAGHFDHSFKTASVVRDPSLPQVSNHMLSRGLDQLSDRKSNNWVQQAKKCIRLNMTLRLVQPAILAYEQKGKLRQVLVPLEVRELTAICLDQRLVSLQYILNLRLLLWLIQRIHTNTSSFASYAGRSLLLREAQLSSNFFPRRIESGDLYDLLRRFKRNHEELVRQVREYLIYVKNNPPSPLSMCSRIG